MANGAVAVACGAVAEAVWAVASGLRGSGLRGSGLRGSGMRGSGLRGSGMRGSGLWGSVPVQRSCAWPVPHPPSPAHIRPLTVLLPGLCGEERAAAAGGVCLPVVCVRLQALTERVDLQFCDFNKGVFAPGDAVTLHVTVKNVPRVTVKVYEANTTAVYLDTLAEISTAMNLVRRAARQAVQYALRSRPAPAGSFRQPSRLFERTRGFSLPSTGSD